ncbi:trimethyltridecatetraene synthase-like [Hibiscus syriacus]|uniref:trimethyltridecatetraene synthase-like n=1 Tax=Hibiscus syriacus TaxID=106335 RepID=UPI0019226770|nr:trimethyltridecatetraene synthase-like [Hibiscus syriacus]
MRRLEYFEYIRVEEIHAFVSRLYGSSGKPVVLIEHLLRVTLSIISMMVLGDKYFGVSSDDRIGSNSVLSLPEFQELLKEFFLLNGVVNIGDWIPWLDCLDLQGYIKRMKAVKGKLDRVLDKHKRKKKELSENFVPQDTVDVLLQLADGPDVDAKLTNDNVKGLIVVIYFAHSFYFPFETEQLFNFY